MRRKTPSALGAALLLFGCTEPAVAARVVWMDETAQGDGSYLLRLYDAGAAQAFPVVPRDPGTVPDQLLLELSPNADAVVVGNTQAGVLFDVRTLQRIDLGGPVVARVAGANGITFSPLSFFAEAGDLLAIADVDVDGAAVGYRLRALDFDPAQEIALEVPEPEPGGTWARPRTARGAPIMVLFHTYSSDSPMGPGLAYRYPGVGSETGQLETLSRAVELSGRTVWNAQAPTLLTHCPGAVCLDPEGTRMFFPSAACAVEQWTLQEDGESPRAHMPTRSETIALPSKCPAISDPLLVGALDADHLVFVDDARVYLANLAEDSLTSVARPTPDGVIRSSQDGRVLLLIDNDGPVVSVDRSGPRILSAAVSPCTGVVGPEAPTFVPATGKIVVSPSGAWAAWTCITGEGGGYGGVTLRVSALGLERLTSVPMQTLAIDDNGDLLLYSVDPDGTGIDGDPRGLFVYSNNGELARVDGLQPTPGRYRMFGDDPFFHAVALP